MRSVTGCLSTAIFWPANGSSIFGVEISTPGIGPATDGLSGVELLDDSHAVRAAAVASAHTAVRILLFIGLFTLGSHRGARSRRACWCTRLLSGRTPRAKG